MQKQKSEYLLSEIQALPLSEQLLLLENLASLVRSKTHSISQPRSILELKGKGKDIWSNIDIENYLNEERTSWNG